MPKYDRERVARLFDEVDDVMNIRGGGKGLSEDDVPALAGRMAFGQLELTAEDVLLDVGTGTGGKAIPAAGRCRLVIGIDISRECLKRARQRAQEQHLDNVVFAYGGFEDPCAELDLGSFGITKILAFYSMHHLPDQMKEHSLKTLADLLRRPGRMVIGDLMFFKDPEAHCEEYDDVHYDGGEVDFPARADFLVSCLKGMGAEVRVQEVHPLVGIIVADF
jgi:SAM-dependent methyltransferase